MDLLSIQTKKAVLCWIAVPASLLFSCSKAVNSPQQVVDAFLSDIRSGSLTSLDTLVDWPGVALKESYVPDSYFKSLNQAAKDSVASSYREYFRISHLPALSKASLKIDQVSVMRKQAEGWLEMSFPSGPGQTARINKCSIKLVYEPAASRWTIVDMGKVLELAQAGADYDSRRYYLQEPANP